MVAIQSVGQLLHTVLKNHSSIAASCPGPVITSINSIHTILPIQYTTVPSVKVCALIMYCTDLVKVFLKFCTLKDEERETSIANTISRYVYMHSYCNNSSYEYH